MAAPAFTAVTGGAIALAAATAKTVLAVVPASNKNLTLVALEVTFDGVTASAVPVLVELCASTGAGAGTSSSVTPGQVRGPLATLTSSAKKTFTVEPTVLTVLKEWLVPPTSGLFYQWPLGREIEAVGTASGATVGGLMLRVTAPAVVNVRASLEFEE